MGRSATGCRSAEKTRERVWRLSVDHGGGCRRICMGGAPWRRRKRCVRCPINGLGDGTQIRKKILLPPRHPILNGLKTTTGTGMDSQSIWPNFIISSSSCSTRASMLAAQSIQTPARIKRHARQLQVQCLGNFISHIFGCWSK